MYQSTRPVKKKKMLNIDFYHQIQRQETVQHEELNVYRLRCLKKSAHSYTHYWKKVTKQFQIQRQETVQHEELNVYTLRWCLKQSAHTQHTLRWCLKHTLREGKSEQNNLSYYCHATHHQYRHFLPRRFVFFFLFFSKLRSPLPLSNLPLQQRCLIVGGYRIYSSSKGRWSGFCCRCRGNRRSSSVISVCLYWP